MEASFPLYWIPLLPLLGAAFNLLWGRKLPRVMVHLVACGAVLGALAVAMVATFHHLYPAWVAVTEAAGEHALAATPKLSIEVFDWIVAGRVDIALGLLMDPLGAVMVLVITFVGFLIHLYSTGYMSEDPDYARFFAYLNLFTGAMLILVLGDNLAVLFVGWEGVGLCSYLLIGFWYDKSGTDKFGDENATAGKKAFIVNRIGDLAFIVGMLVLFAAAGTLNIGELSERASMLTRVYSPWGLVPVSIAGAAALLLFIGATGKSAQIPLYIWLPDAMAGPTPVSALIHAATMVTAGVYMVTRMGFLFMLSPAVMALIAIVGALTAFFAATIGFAQNDIKKVLAYSTISQLGYMFIGAGVGAFSAAVFHLFTHAFFKACLFLGAGAVIHALGGEQDMRAMGGLRKRLPLTHLTMLISTLAIAGFIGFSGFFSKDEILWKAFTATNPAVAPWVMKLVYVFGLAGALCTAFYMFRLYYLTFSGESRAPKETLDHLHAPGPAMTVPLLVLAFGALVLGVLGLPAVLSEHNYFHQWLAPVVDRAAHVATATGYLERMSLAPVGQDAHIAHNHGIEGGLMVLSFVIALIGIGVARMYYRGGASPKVKGIVERISSLHGLVEHKFYVDEIYGWIVVRPFKLLASVLFKVADRVFIDIIAVNGSAFVVDMVGKLARWFHNGNLQQYVVSLVVGVAVILLVVASPPDDFVVEPAGPITVGERVKFDASRPQAVDGRTLEYRWDFDGDGRWDFPAPAADKGAAGREGFTRATTASFVYDKAGSYKVVLEVHDPRWGTRATETHTVKVTERSQGRATPAATPTPVAANGPTPAPRTAPAARTAEEVR